MNLHHNIKFIFIINNELSLLNCFRATADAHYLPGRREHEDYCDEIIQYFFESNGAGNIERMTNLSFRVGKQVLCLKIH